MKLAKPVTISPITDVTIIADALDRNRKIAEITVGLLNDSGQEVARQTVMLRPEIEKDGVVVEETAELIDGERVVTGRKTKPKKEKVRAFCRAIVWNPNGVDYASATMLVPVELPTAYDDYLVARRSDDDVAAIKAAGAGTWLFPSDPEK